MGPRNWSLQDALDMIAKGRYACHTAQLLGIHKSTLTRRAYRLAPAEYRQSIIAGFKARLDHALANGCVNYTGLTLTRDSAAAPRHAPAWLITPEYRAGLLEYQRRLRIAKRNSVLANRAKYRPKGKPYLIDVVHCTNHEDSHG